MSYSTQFPEHNFARDFATAFPSGPTIEDLDLDSDLLFAPPKLPVEQKSVGKSADLKEVQHTATKLEHTPHKDTVHKIRKWLTLPIRLPLKVAGGLFVGGGVAIGVIGCAIPVGIGALVGGGIGMLTGKGKQGAVIGAAVGLVPAAPVVLGAGLAFLTGLGFYGLESAIKGKSKSSETAKILAQLQSLRDAFET